MVRLKVLDGLGYSPLARLFQFQYGSIKSSGNSLNVIITEYFNSNMVRLKGCRGCNSCTCREIFQFQYGSIKRHDGDPATFGYE